MMSLKRYEQKRNFKVTSEPKPRVAKSPDGPIFVVQEHHASRLHYDFRIEADGVLKSWAVTKEPTLDPSVKRLAVQVEDHPLAYASFSGDIPKGEYGAGHVEIWDRGSYENVMEEKPEPRSIAEGIEEGHLELELHGKKLKGKFALIRMKGEDGKNWLMIKMKDGYEREGDGGSGREGDGNKREGDGGNEEERERETRKGTRATKDKGATKRGIENPKSKIQNRTVVLSSPDKVMFPEAGLTKEEVFRFYEGIADYLLPHLIDRPMTLERLPDGLTGPRAPHFWQKDTPDYYPEWIPRVELQSEQGEPVKYLLVNDKPTLLYLVNMGTITFHPWLSRIDNLDRPDFVLFDLDPGPKTFADAITVAKELHAILDDAGTESFVKTSGKTGIHILAPWKDNGGYDEAREWAMEMAMKVVEELPDLATVERRKAKRSGKLYLDVMQNARGHHVVPPYVLRAVPQATVSAPIRWEELKADLTPAKFDTRSIFRRLAHMKNDPIAPLAKTFKRRRSRKS
jgi:bifunctional non-homologous end joining protein LigD